ncbi:hypothetical protein BB559_002857 [Furculomyces boomerangus]|uniref:RRM domain-containing protein n=2 Tax=Harpellales TaxID=61421 RepID=A0A2T9YDU4_9FUNG|nr:hypothetical protein BB559_004602 [Furculomyces boomerangus]PVU94971.1 hypothetical protein BB559_002857 [Furculomyces boomerangus]PVZ98476.1 hypothetical protein BB558_005509 [Smittium angustum]
MPSDSTAKVADLTDSMSKIDLEDYAQKVFVGNLPFSATNESLSEVFEKAGKVKHARVITRGRRSLGYGFVVFEDGVDIDSAVQALNKQELDGREINVEAARPMDKERKPRPPRRHSQNSGPGSRRPPRRSTHPKEASGEEAGNGENDKSHPRSFRQNTRRSRPPRERGEQVESENMVFVANLPYSTKDEDLKELFSEFKVSEARVAMRTFANRSTRSKGFGFVTFESHEEQLRALKACTEKPLVLDNRDLSVKPALANVEPREEPAAPAAEEKQ